MGFVFFSGDVRHTELLKFAFGIAKKLQGCLIGVFKLQGFGIEHNHRIRFIIEQLAVALFALAQFFLGFFMPALQLYAIQCIINGVDQLGCFKGLSQIIVSAVAQRLNGGFHGDLSGHDDHQRFRSGFMNLVHDLIAVDVRQSDIL